jgi:oxygen-independent coproporphyrinogen-3 oxidase
MADYLYLHVPFCRTICFYCDFCHTVYTREHASQWLAALQQELAGRNLNRTLKTIYIGGGTPTALDADQLEQLLRLLDPYREHVQEFTVEINPESLDEAKAGLLEEHGVNRASIGFQTSDPQLLKAMNRRHTCADVQRAVELLRRHRIENLSLDLMYSLPGQTMAQLEQSVRDALALQPSHLSLYSLNVEPDTVFGRRGLKPLDDDAEADMYEWICRTLPEHGYHQYEISNFCLPGRESVHNTAYWKYLDFYGVSAGASGKEGRRRYDKPKSLAAYCRDPLACTDIPLSQKESMFEMLMMSLRLKQGLDQEAFAKAYGRTVDEAWGPVKADLIRRGLLQEQGRQLACTDRGYEILNDVLEEFL